jgi:hypothetical protein
LDEVEEKDTLKKTYIYLPSIRGASKREEPSNWQKASTRCY